MSDHPAPQSTLPELSKATNIRLTKPEEALIQNAHPGYGKIILEKEFGGGYSGTRVFLVLPVKPNGVSDARIVTKLGAAVELRREKENYDKYVKSALPFSAAQIMRAYEQDEQAAVNYAFAGGAALGKTVSLEEYYLDQPAETINKTLDALLDQTLGNAWYGQNQSFSGLFREEYGRHLPPHDELAKIVSDIYPRLSPVDGKHIRIPGLTGTYPDPLTVYPDVLDQTLKGRRSFVHGDLHTRNVLVDESGRGWLIDFAKVKERHNLFDFIKLETYIRLMALPQVFGAFSSNEYIQFEQALNAATLTQASTPPANPELAKAYQVIRAIRQIAQKYMGHNPDFRGEYFPALFLYALSMLKYFPTNGPIPTQLIFLTTCSLALPTQPTVTPQIRVETKRVELVLEGEFSEFTSKRQQDIVSVLAALLRIDPVHIRVLKVSEGSILITLEMPYSAANHLYEMATKSDFRIISMGIKSIMVEDREIVKLGGKTVPIPDNKFGVSAKNAKEKTTTTDHSLPHQATLNGDGAIAQGDNAKAVGQGGISIGGNARDNVIISGDHNKVNKTTTRKVDTGGGAYIGGNLNLQNGDFVGRDKVDHSIKVGDISNVNGLAIGHNAKVNLTQNSGASADEIAAAFTLLLQKVDEMRNGPAKTMTQTAVQGLKTEAEKNQQADEENVGEWFNSLARIAPDIWDVAVDTFVNPIKGLSTVFQKIAKRAKEEREKR